jgi:hypothetical protein
MMLRVHALATFVGVLVVGWIVLTGWAPVQAPGATVPESVRANPASYRPVYIPTSRGGSSGGSGGGWSGGK